MAEYSATAEAGSLTPSDVLTNTIDYITEQSDSLSVESTQSASQYAYGMGYAWAIARTTQSCQKISDCTMVDTFTASDLMAAWRGFYVALADMATIEEITSVYTDAIGVINEALAWSDNATTIAVSWGFAVETSFVVDASTNVANMNAAGMEIFTSLDSYSAINIECYFPEMTVTYGEREYSAAYSMYEIEAVVTGVIVATLNPAIYIAIKGE